MTVLVFGTLRFPPDSMAEVRAPLKALVDTTRRLDGCIAYDVAEDLFDPGLIRFSEIWPNADLLAAHPAAPHIAPWRDAARRLGLIARDFTAWNAENPRPV